MIRKFRNKTTGKPMNLDSEKDKNLIQDLEKDSDWQEMIYT